MSNAIEINYTDLSFEVLVKIFELADLLGCTPVVAAKVWLVNAGRKDEVAA